MAKASINTGDEAQPVHTRTTGGVEESQAVVLGIDGSDSVIPADATYGMAVAEGGTYGYKAGTATGVVDVPSTARLRRVTVIASASQATTLTINGGDTITIPAGGSFDEQIPGRAVGADVVINGGAPQSYYVSWVN